MRLLYVTLAYNTHDERFLRACAGAGFETHYFPVAPGGVHTGDRPLPDGVIPHLPRSTEGTPWSGGAVERALALRRVIAAIRPAVALAGPIQTGTWLAAVVGYRPIVAMSWGSDMLVDAFRSPWMYAKTGLALRRSTALFADCNAVRDAAGRFVSDFGQRSLIFPWGIDVERFTPGPSGLALRRDLGWMDNPVFISTRNWEGPYAIDVLMRAFAMLRRRRPDARLLLAGEGSEGPLIRKLIGELGLEPDLHVLGRLSGAAMPDYLRSADIYVSSALSDGTSVSLLEAMGCGLPIVASAAFGNLEWVTPGVNGWLATPGDPQSLAAGMEAALVQWPVPSRISQENVALVRRRADWSCNVPRLMTLLADVGTEAMAAR